MLRGSDADKSGTISFEEFVAGSRVTKLPEDVQRRLFERLDKDGDGEIRRDEVSKPKGWGRGGPGPDGGARHHGPHDPDGDGRVSLEEFRKNPRIAPMEADRQAALFAKMDRNDDGFLDRKDYMGRRPGRDGNGHGPRGPMNPPRMIQDLDADKDGSLSFEEFHRGSGMKEVNEDRAEEMFQELDRNGDGKLVPEELRGERRGPWMGPGSPGKGPRGQGVRPDGPRKARDGESPRPSQRPANPPSKKPGS
jgi:Ca2+-binding EF-hand superfamily protein